MPNKPLKEFRIGSVRASLWLNSDGKRKYTTITLERRYFGRDQQWHSSNSFYPAELGNAAAVALKARDWWLDHGHDYDLAVDNAERDAIMADGN